MAKFSYDILFGSDINPKLRSKLQVRQNLARSSTFGESVDFSGSFANPRMMTDRGFGDITFGDVNTTDFNSELDLSSRTPWVRMWVGVEKFSLSPDINELNRLSKSDANKYIENLRNGEGDIKRNVNGIDVHVVGNNEYHSYEKQTSVNSSVTVDVGDSQTTIKSANLWDSRNNDFLEAMPGILELESADSGDYGLIRETTVRFHIPSYDDFVNVFQPFFLLPGARIFVDFGWSTANIYDPIDLLKNHYSGEDMFEKIWGENGIIDDSLGDLEVLTGTVSKYDTNVEEDGSFTCSVTIVSYNYSLLDKTSSADLGDKATISDFMKVSINERIRKYAELKFNMDLSNIPVDDKSLVSEVLPTVLAPTQTFAYLGTTVSDDEKWKTTGGVKLKAIPEDYYHQGIYFDPVGALG